MPDLNTGSGKCAAHQRVHGLLAELSEWVAVRRRKPERGEERLPGRVVQIERLEELGCPLRMLSAARRVS